jgi:hypothetical protein
MMRISAARKPFREYVSAVYVTVSCTCHGADDDRLHKAVDDLVGIYSA